jgi:hypothetical protein
MHYLLQRLAAEAMRIRKLFLVLTLFFVASLCPRSIGFVPVAYAQAQAAEAQRVTLPLASKSVRFAVIGDSGTGDRPQYQVGEQLEAFRKITDFNFVLMLGDNIYGGDHPDDFVRKFEQPYKPLLDAGVKFYASLGNHDNPNQDRYTDVRYAMENLFFPPPALFRWQIPWPRPRLARPTRAPIPEVWCECCFIRPRALV